MEVEIYPASLEELCQSLGIERSISQKERDAIDDSDFAGPHQSFPIDSQEHLDAAAHLIGHADDPEAVKRKAIAIAKRKGFTLPKAWQEEEKGKEDRAQMPEHAMLYAPITRIDSEKREVEGVATSEAVDSYGTIFSYEASKQAFQKWIERTANVREMHDRRAVGKGVGVFFDDAAKQVIVRSRVSKGAQDTWIKIEEGVLSGYSVGATNPVWSQVERNGKTYPYLTSYDLAELSYVDNASNPDGQGLAICRADGLLTEVVDTTEPEPEEQAPNMVVTSPEVVERAGARVSSDTQNKMHASIGHGLHSVVGQMQNCDCPRCQAAMELIDPDGDGDIDLGGYDDPDNDWQSLYNLGSDDDMPERVQQAVERAMAPVYARFQQSLARLAQYNPEPVPVEIPNLDAITQQLTALNERVERVANASSLDEVRASLEAVKGQVDRIAAQPQPGGPVLNGARPVDKSLMSSNHAAPMQHEHMLAALERMQQAGALDTIDKQVAAAALAVVPTRGRIG